jgi:transcription elongation GreA/GreB family factor
MARSRVASAAVDKATLRAELMTRLGEMLANARAAHAAAVEGATHGEAKPENDKDTRGLEQSYIARGQAARVVELEHALALIDKLPFAPWPDDAPIAAGALVTAREGTRQQRYFIAGAGGGEVLAGGTVQVVTPSSPLGRALCGKRVSDEAELRGPGGAARELTIDDVA